MGAMASQITSLTSVYSTVHSGADQRKRQSSASLAFVWGIHRWPVNSPHKGPVMREMFPFDDVIMSLNDKGGVWCARNMAQVGMHPEGSFTHARFHVKYLSIPRIQRNTNDDVTKWKHFLGYWPVTGGPPHRRQWRGALIFSLICTRRNGWANNREAFDSDRTVLILTSL